MVSEPRVRNNRGTYSSGRVSESSTTVNCSSVRCRASVTRPLQSLGGISRLAGPASASMVDGFGSVIVAYLHTPESSSCTPSAWSLAFSSKVMSTSRDAIRDVGDSAVWSLDRVELEPDGVMGDRIILAVESVLPKVVL